MHGDKKEMGQKCQEASMDDKEDANQSQSKKWSF